MQDGAWPGSGLACQLQKEVNGLNIAENFALC